MQVTTNLEKKIFRQCSAAITSHHRFSQEVVMIYMTILMEGSENT